MLNQSPTLDGHALLSLYIYSKLQFIHFQVFILISNYCYWIFRVSKAKTSKMLESGLAETLMRVAMFFVVQALVYLILSKSSSIFSTKTTKRSHSFKPARSVSVRRILAALSDMPVGGEPSPLPTGKQSPTGRQDNITSQSCGHI